MLPPVYIQVMELCVLKLIFVLIVSVCKFGDVEALRGDCTFYYTWKDGYGSCGLERSMHDKFYVLALSMKYMKLPPNVTNPNNHPLCAPNVCARVHGPLSSVVLKVSDTCMGCKDDDIDVADTVFPLLDDPKLGRVKMDWEFVDCSEHPPGPVQTFLPSATSIQLDHARTMKERAKKQRTMMSKLSILFQMKMETK
jgi:hypothetical protein